MKEKYKAVLPNSVICHEEVLSKKYKTPKYNELPANVNPEPHFCVDFDNHSNCLLSLKNHVSERCPSTASKNRPKIKSGQYFCIFEFQNLSLEGEKICLKEAEKVR